MIKSTHRSAAAIIISLLSLAAMAHPGPEPTANWVFAERFVKDGKLVAQQGPDVRLHDDYTIGQSPLGEYLDFFSTSESLLVADDIASVRDCLPKEHMTVTAWVTVDKPQEWGGIIGAIQDNGNSEQGWILGYDRSTFYFGLASTGGDDGDGRITYLKGKTRYEPGRFYWVVATYDGQAMRLYVNGQLEAQDTQSQSGPLCPRRLSGSQRKARPCRRNEERHAVRSDRQRPMGPGALPRTHRRSQSQSIR